MDSIPDKAIWVRFPRFIGDGIMIHRAIEPLRDMNSTLVAWGPAQVMELFQGNPGFAATVADPPSKQSAWKMARLLRAHRAQGVISLLRSQRANLAALLAGVPLRVGWREGMGRLICTHSLSFKATPGHQQERYAILLRTSFGELQTSSFVAFSPRLSAQVEAEALLAEVQRPFVVFSLGALSSSKRLGRKVWTALGEQVLARGWSIVLLGATVDDQGCAQYLSSQIKPVHDLVGKTSLAVAAGVIRKSQGLFGNDSALSHLAAACGIPTVVAFGPTEVSMTAPVGAWVRVVRREELACLGCQEGACPLPDHPCMEDIRADDLLAALQEARLSAF
jgi:ADP-heptose:LPS heptosyltransferase